MNGFLTKKMMDNLNSAGFDINKFYSDCCYKKSFLIVEKRRKLTEDEKQEMISDGDEKVELKYYPKGRPCMERRRKMKNSLLILMCWKMKIFYLFK